LDFFMAARRSQRFWRFVYNPNMAWRIGYLDVVVPHGPGDAAVLIGLVLALAVIAGGIWWVRRRRKRA
jgi:LPXTG-motif cell wall-anchored protein